MKKYFEYVAALLAVAGVAVTIGVSAVSFDNQFGGTSGLADPVSRTGTVVASPPATGSIVWVDLGGPTPMDLPYLAPYVPVPGDQVEVIFRSVKGSMVGLVIGGRAGQSGNLIPNGNFSAQPQPSLASLHPPYMWAQYHASGANVSLFGGLDSVTGASRPSMILGGDFQSASDDYAYSAAIAVKPGDVFNVDSLWNAIVIFPPGLNVYTVAGFFAAATDAWPDALSTVTLATDNLSGTGPFKRWQSGQLSVPASAGGEPPKFVRIAIRALVTGGGGGGGGYSLWMFEVQMRRPA